MSAPQHKAPEGKRPNKRHKSEKELGQKDMGQLSTSYKMQRCWFMALGLVGGFGFISSQVSFARAEDDLFLNDYAADSGSDNFSVADTTFSTSGSLAGTSFNPPAAGAIPDAFIDAPPAPAAVVETFTYSEPTPEPAAYVPPYEVKPAAAEAPAITIEIEEAQPLAPEVTPVAPPTFTAVTTPKKTAHSKITRRRNPLLGMMEASALAAPLSNYVSNSSAAVAATMAVNVTDSRTADTLNVVEIANRRTGTLVAVDAAVEATAVEAAIEPAPVVPDILPAPSPASSPEPSIAAPEPAAAAPAVDLAPIAEEAPIQPTEIVPAALPEGSSLPEEYNNIFVDPTDYSIGATEAPEVVVSEQSTGCEFTVGGGQGVPNGACGTGLSPAPSPLGAPEYEQAPIANQQVPAEQNYYQEPVASAPAVNVGPVSFSTAGIRFNSSTTAAGREYLNRSVRPMVNLQAAEQFIFPLAIPSPITSLFGFRVHPVTGQQRFHAGTDLGAEYGTPVLATQDGTVVSADYAGGYGLMVVLDHEVEETQLQSRYAHLSDILVEPGSTVKKGDVIGLVGSTGVSTGPHLHFEMLQNTADGWVLVNADGLVQNSLAKLVKALNSPMQAVNFSLADLNLNLGSIKRTPIPAQPGSANIELPQPGQNGISFRPAQPNAS
ncbi:MAG: peptidoglycan DD-metalloendopeptidase family protein [Phormidesmis sp.]